MSKRSLIDSIEVKNACSEDWNRMAGSDKVRFCSHCALEVNNISALTRKQAMRLVNGSNGRICVRYVKNPADDSPVFAGSKLYRITRRAGIAAGVLGATLAVSSLAHAQGSGPVSWTQKAEISQTETAGKNKSESGAATVTGTVTDPTGALVPNATVILVTPETGVKRAVAASEEGFYKFENVSAGKYKVEATGVGFMVTTREIDVFDNKENVADLTLEAAETTVTVGDIAIVEYSHPLFLNVSRDEIAEVRNLIIRGENVNVRDENYSKITPLFLAVENGNAEIAQLLLNFGAKVNARDANRQTPLMRLDEDASVGLVDLLIRHGARAGLVDKEGSNALMLAARSVKADVLQILIRHSPNIDARNAAGRTALMEAADADNFEAVRALLLAGAEANLKDADGETAFDLTTDEEIERLLESYGAKIGNAPNDPN
jgi:hypothetical protein